MAMPTSASEVLVSMARKETQLLDLTCGTFRAALKADSDGTVIDCGAITDRLGLSAPASECR
ncbi:MAG: hypothetical protein OXG79_09085 [Chloroflexi bacterium]|nr:hypothetical protein [Chloroflexota bacterium]